MKEPPKNNPSPQIGQVWTSPVAGRYTLAEFVMSGLGVRMVRMMAADKFARPRTFSAETLSKKWTWVDTAPPR